MRGASGCARSRWSWVGLSVLVAMGVAGVAPAHAVADTPNTVPAPTSTTASATSTSDTPVPDRRETTTKAKDDGINAWTTDQKQAAAQPVEPVPSRPVGPVLVQFIRAEACGVLSAGDGFEGLFPCSDGVVRDHSDVCGEAPVILPTWRRDRVSESADWGRWALVADVSCAGGPVPSGDQVLAEFRRLRLAPSPLTVQPDADEVLVQMDTIAFTDDTPQVLSTTLLGVVVEFTVSPVAFTWDFGPDGGVGAAFTTTSPGHPYPDQDVAYAYRHVGTGQVTLTTTWAATYTVGSDPTVRDVPGTATTTSTSHEFEIRELHTHLVAGTCAQNPTNPGC